MLSADELSRMQATQASAMPDAVSLWNATPVSDGAGGETYIWAKVSDTTGRMGSPGGALRIVAEKLTDAKVWQITLPEGQPLAVGQRLTILGRNYRVVYVDAPKSWSTATRGLVTAEE